MFRGFLCIALLLGTTLFAEELNVQPIKGGPVHEAYLAQEYGEALLTAVPSTPPTPIAEPIPPQADAEALWIPGYWGWSQDRNDFVWICGVWRKYPPGHIWIEGYWKQFPEGWVWIPGFWSLIPFEKVTYLVDLPPQLINEQPSDSPGADYFWMPGFWQYDNAAKHYAWNEGRYEMFDPNWVWVPATYIWREKGYVFIPGYWDWPLEKRGAAYSAVFILPDVRLLVIYEPDVILEPLEIVETYYPFWPDYGCFFHHHYHYHGDFWSSWGMAPPWWAWESWWALTPTESWGVWWWWCTPGYPQPSWLTSKISSLMVSPSLALYAMMKHIFPPAWVTADGAVSEETFLKAKQEVMGTKLPILPTDPSRISDIQYVAKPLQEMPKPFLRPSGKSAIISTPPQPLFEQKPSTLATPSEPFTPPSKPTFPVKRPVQPKRPIQAGIPANPPTPLTQPLQGVTPKPSTNKLLPSQSTPPTRQMQPTTPSTSSSPSVLMSNLPPPEYAPPPATTRPPIRNSQPYTTDQGVQMQGSQQYSSNRVTPYPPSGGQMLNNSVRPNGSSIQPNGTYIKPNSPYVPPSGTYVQPAPTSTQPKCTYGQPNCMPPQPTQPTQPGNTSAEPSSAQSNSTVVQPNNPSNQSNGPYFQPSGTYYQSNGTYVQPPSSNGAYVQPNGTYVRPNGSYVQPNGTYVAPSPTYQPNTSYVHPNPTYVQPNGNIIQPNGAYVQPNGTYVQPNSTYVLPNNAYVQPNGAYVVPPSTPTRPTTTLQQRYLQQQQFQTNDVIATPPLKRPTYNQPVNQKNYPSNSSQEPFNDQGAVKPNYSQPSTQTTDKNPQLNPPYPLYNQPQTPTIYPSSRAHPAYQGPLYNTPRPTLTQRYYTPSTGRVNPSSYQGPPYQGALLGSDYAHEQFYSKSQGNLMNYPQPQRNAGPAVNQFPDTSRKY